MLAILLLTGCNAFGTGKLAKQLQEENDRLVTEFRAQRERSEELLQANRQLERRIAESEKLLARQHQSGSRISSLNSGRALGGPYAPGISRPRPQENLRGSQAPSGDSNASGLQWESR